MTFWGSVRKSIKYVFLAIVSFYISSILEANLSGYFYLYLIGSIIILLVIFDYIVSLIDRWILNPFKRDDHHAAALIALRAAYNELKYLAKIRGIDNLQFRLNLMLMDKKFVVFPKGLRIFTCYPFQHYEPCEKKWNFVKNEGVVGWCFENGEDRVVNVSNSDWVQRLPNSFLSEEKANTPKIQEIKWICSKIVLLKGKKYGIITLDSTNHLTIVDHNPNGDPVYHSKEFMMDMENVLKLLAQVIEYVLSGDSVGLKNQLERRTSQVSE